MRRTLFSSILAAAACVPLAASAAIPGDLQLVEFASGLTSPVAIRHAGDGSGRIYVVQRNGVLRTYAADGTALGTLLSFADDPPLLGFSTGGGGDERGLLGLAFHPDFPTDPRMFVYYNDGNSDTVIASYEVAGDPPVADPSSQEIVLRLDQDSSNHNGGDIHFGADDYLYIGMGDGGGANDTCDRAQTLDPDDLVLTGGCSPDASFTGDNPDSLALLGKMLRIDVDAGTLAGANGLCGGNADGSANYAVPVGNPFADGSTANGCDEVWHYGLRNPYRFSFDRATGDMFIGDVGQSASEEIDYSAVDSGGLNFGWRPCEGRFVRGSTSTACNLAGSTLPILDYGRSGGACAVTGGFRYRGPITALDGDYIYADYCNGRVYIASESAGTWTPVLWQDQPFNITGFGEDEQGHLYLTDFNGRVLRFDSPSAGGVSAEDDSFQLDEDTPTTLDVLDNDGAGAVIASVTTPDHGSATNNGDDVLYSPHANYCGSDSFDYTLEAGGGTATVTLAVECVEDGNAIAVDDSFQVQQGSSGVPLEVLANDGPDPDPEQNPIAITALVQPPNGTAANQGGERVLYTPDAGFCGIDAFTYTISGGDTAAVEVEVACIADLVFRNGFEGS